MVHELRLYITGKTDKTNDHIKFLKKIIKEDLEDKYKLKVIDILKNPKLAEDEKIFATPMLEKKLPVPIRRIIGEMQNKEKILLGLDIRRKK